MRELDSAAFRIHSSCGRPKVLLLAKKPHVVAGFDGSFRNHPNDAGIDVARHSARRSVWPMLNKNDQSLKKVEWSTESQPTRNRRATQALEDV